MTLTGYNTGKGVITVGSGLYEGAEGDILFSPSERGAARRAIESGLKTLKASGGGELVLLPSPYYFDDGPVNVTHSVTIRTQNGAKLYPRHSLEVEGQPGVKAAGIFEVKSSASGARFLGEGQVVVDQFKPDQDVARFTSCADTVWSIDIIATTEEGQVGSGASATHSTTPMNMLGYYLCPSKIVRDCIIRTKQGMRGIYASQGQQLVMRNVLYGNRDNFEIVNAEKVHSHAEYCVLLRNDGWADIQGCEFRSIGIFKLFGPAVSAICEYRGDLSGTGPAGEKGHLTWRDNHIEDCFRSYDIRLKGCWGADIEGNAFNNSVATMDTETEACIMIDAAEGPEVCSNQVCSFVQGGAGVGKINLSSGSWTNTPAVGDYVRVAVTNQLTGDVNNDAMFRVQSATSSQITIGYGQIYTMNATQMDINITRPCEEIRINNNSCHNLVDASDPDTPTAATGSFIRALCARAMTIAHNTVSLFRGRYPIRLERLDQLTGVTVSDNVFESGRLATAWDSSAPLSDYGPVAAIFIGRRQDDAGGAVPHTMSRDIVIENNIARTGDQAPGATNGIFENGMVEIAGNGNLEVSGSAKDVGVTPADAAIAGRIQ